MGYVESGHELIEAFTQICAERNIRSGVLHAIGNLADAEIAHFDMKRRVYRMVRRISAPMELIQLSGNISIIQQQPVVRANVILARDNQEHGGAIDVLAGSLVRAKVLAVEFTIEAHDGATLKRISDPDTGLPGLELGGGAPALAGITTGAPAAAAPMTLQAKWNTPTPAVSPKPASAPPTFSPPFVQADRDETVPRIPLQRPPSIEEEEEEEEEELNNIALLDDDFELRVGDYLNHPRFGECEVQRISEDGEHIAVRTSDQRLIELGLEVLHINFVQEKEDERRLFKVTPKRN